MSKNYEVKITKQAQEQMREIVHYISHELFAPDAAVNLLNHLENSINSLSEMPERMSLVEEEPWCTEGVRKVVVKNFLVYFWIDKVNMKVHITAVVYGKRNQVKQLLKMDFKE